MSDYINDVRRDKATIAAQAQTIAELTKALRNLDAQFYVCEECDGYGIEPDTEADACERCGGYGFNPGGDIRQAMVDARAAIVSVVA